MRKIYWLIIIIILLFPVIGILFYPYLPEQMGTHWGSSGDMPDDYMGKFAGTFVVAIVLMGIITILLAVNVVSTRICAKNYSSKKPMLFFDCFTVLLSMFLLTAYISVLIWNAGANFSMPKFANISGGILIALMLAATFYIVTRKSEVPGKITDTEIDYISAKGEHKDKLIEISGDTAVFKNYYFPTGSKSIKLSQVEYVEEKPPTLRNGKWRLHGTGDPLFRIWFPADYDRPSRDKIFTMKVKNKWIRIGFTVENSLAVSELFKTKGLLR